MKNDAAQPGKTKGGTRKDCYSGGVNHEKFCGSEETNGERGRSIAFNSSYETKQCQQSSNSQVQVPRSGEEEKLIVKTNDGKEPSYFSNIFKDQKTANKAKKRS